MISSELKAVRTKMGISRLELAALTGIMESYIEDIEERKIIASEADLKRFEKAFAEYKKVEED